jgi:hypothetical protein
VVKGKSTHRVIVLQETMGRVLIGMLLGAALTAGGGYLWWRQQGQAVAPQPEAPKAPDPKQPVAKKRRHRTGGGSAEGPAAREVTLKPGDEKMQTRGDALGRTEQVDFGASGPEAKDLTEEDLDRVWKRAQPGISKCIGDAIGDAPLETGKVVVGIRVEKEGNVSRVRVDAPALLLRNNLHSCVRGHATALRFPRSGGASVVSYPFQLQ